MKGCGDVDDALARTGAARGQRCALPTAVAFAHITTARHHQRSSSDQDGRLGDARSEARVGQIYFGDPVGKWVSITSALTSIKGVGRPRPAA